MVTTTTQVAALIMVMQRLTAVTMVMAQWKRLISGTNVHGTMVAALVHG